MAYSQTNRSIAIIIDVGKAKSNDQGDDDLLLHQLSGNEGLSQLYSYELVLLSEKDDLTAADFLNVKASVRISLQDGKGKRFINGIVTEFEAAGPDQTRGLYRYHVVLRPGLWKLSQNRACRVFNDKNVTDILKSVLGDWSQDVNFDDSSLPTTYKPSQCCIQYMESDYNFISRLMEKEGIFFFFEHQATDGKTQPTPTLKLVSKNSDLHNRTNESPIPYDATCNTTSTNAGIFAWSERTRAVPSGPHLRDYDFRQAATAIEKDPTSAKPFDKCNSLIYPGTVRNLQNTSDIDSTAAHYVDVEADSIRSQQYTWSGSSNDRTTIAADIIRISGFPGECKAEPVLIRQISVNAESDYTHADETQFTYGVTLNGQPNKQQFYAPINSPSPQLYGLQTGVVVTDKSGEGDAQKTTAVSTDQYGRVKVAFHWMNDNSKYCWVRVSQTRADGQSGNLNLPRAGEEVIISFANGNPNEPLVVGSVHNSRNKVPMDLEKAKNMPNLISRSRILDQDNMVPGTALAQANPVDKEDVSTLKSSPKGYHELSLVDTQDKQQVGIYSNKELLAQAAETVTVNAGKKITIEADEEIELKVGGTSLKLTKDIAELKVDWGSELVMDHYATEITSWQVGITGWLSAEMKTFLSSINAEMIGVSIVAPEIKASSGLFNIDEIGGNIIVKGVVDAGKSVADNAGATNGMDSKQATIFDHATGGTGTAVNVALQGVGGLAAIYHMIASKGTTLLGSSVAKMNGGETDIKAGYMSILGFADVPVPLFGKLDLYSSGTTAMKGVKLTQDHIESEFNALKQAANYVEESSNAVQQKRNTVDAEKRALEERLQSLQSERDIFESNASYGVRRGMVGEDSLQAGLEERDEAIRDVQAQIDQKEATLDSIDSVLRTIS